MAWRAVLFAVLSLILAQAVGAQQLQVRPGGFLVIDQEALFTQTAFGKRILEDTDIATKALVAENHEIEKKLVAEERELTERRPTLPADEFRKLADAFDDRVQQIRDTQAQKSDVIGSTLDGQRRAFFQAIIPVLAEILRETQAVAILDKRTVLISISLIDVTDLAVARIDQKLGDGRGVITPANGANEPSDTGQSGDAGKSQAPSGVDQPPAGGD